MKLQFLGAAQTVTGSRYLLSTDQKKILVDCGLFQGRKELRLRNWAPFPMDQNTIDAVILTHAHLDHSGYLPLLVKNGYNNPIYCSSATKELCGILLPDSGHLQEEEAKMANKYGYSKHKVATPLYTEEDGLDAIPHITSIPFNQPIVLGDNTQFHLTRAGHILGAACVHITHQQTSILFSGDLGRMGHDNVMNPPKLVEGADYVIIESTYGNRLHSNTNHLDQLSDIINRTIKRGGSVLIPAFAIGRSQHILYDLYQLRTTERIPDIPIFLDSPMAINATKILTEHDADHALSSELVEKVCATAQYTTTPKESKKLDRYTIPKIIISASGMATGGRILHHLKIYARSYRNTILFTGFQAEGTRGDRIVQGEKEIKIHGEMVPIKAEVQMLSNMSAHADYSETLEWLGHFTHHPRKVFITHGNPESAHSLKTKIEDQFGWQCEIPQYLQEENL